MNVLRFGTPGYFIPFVRLGSLRDVDLLGILGVLPGSEDVLVQANVSLARKEQPDLSDQTRVWYFGVECYTCYTSGLS
jgi:hypothetical protein